MTIVFQRHRISIALVLATVSVGLMPAQTAAWNIGTPMVSYWNGPGTLLWGEHFGTLDDASAQQVANAGFNVALANTYQEVQVAQSHGLRTMLQSDLLTAASLDGGTKQAQLDAMIDQYKASPAAYGYLIADEPTAAQFSDLGKIVSYVRQRDPNHLAYINLLPTYNFDSSPVNFTNTTNAYNSYLSQYVSAVQPSLLSYDHYSFGVSGDSREYLMNLGLIAKSAKQAGVPFVNTVQACSWDTSAMRVPNAAETRFLIYSTLAYGAQGISYFQYTQADAPQMGGIVQRDGTPMPIYTTIQAGNREFVNIAKQYQSLKWIGTYLKGYRSTAMPPGTDLLPSSSSFSIASGTSTLPNNITYKQGDALKGVLLGLFDADGNLPRDATFALVQNLDYSAERNYTLTGPGDLSIFDAGTGRWIAMGSNRISLDLAAGGGVLVGLTSAIPAPEPPPTALLGTGLIGLLCFLPIARRRQKQIANA